MSNYTNNLDTVKDNISSDRWRPIQRGEGMGRVLSNDNTFPFAFNNSPVGGSRPDPLALRFALFLDVDFGRTLSCLCLNKLTAASAEYYGYLDYTPNLAKNHKKHRKKNSVKGVAV